MEKMRRTGPCEESPVCHRVCLYWVMHRVSSVSSIDSMWVFLTCQKTQVGKKGCFLKSHEFDPERIHAGTLGSTALPPIPLVVCILAIGFATGSDDATGRKLSWESVVI